MVDVTEIIVAIGNHDERTGTAISDISATLILADKFIGGGNGTAGLAASSTAGAAVANPMIIATMAPEFMPVAQSATSLVAASVIVTSILVPILTAYWSQYMKKKNKDTISPDSKATV